MDKSRILGSIMAPLFLKQPEPSPKGGSHIQQTSAFPQLPHDVIGAILDNLDLHDKFLLSQTCHVLRTLASQNWEQVLQGLSQPEEFNFWTRVAYTKPDCWVCACCCRLRATRPRNMLRVLPLFRSCDSYETVRLWAPRYSSDTYELRHRDVQMALKHHSRPVATSASRLKELLAPYGPIISSGGSFSAEPRIVGGRFLLHSRWAIWAQKRFETLSRTTVGRLRFELCPHLELFLTDVDRVTPALVGTRSSFSAGLEMAVSQAFEDVGTSFDGHCDHCFTDFSVRVSSSGPHRGQPQITFDCWRDFGMYDAPDNLVWASQVWSPENTPHKAYTTWDRTPGSVRENFMSGASKSN